MVKPTVIRSMSAFVLFNMTGLISGVFVGLRTAAIGNHTWWWTITGLIVGVVVSEIVVFGSRSIWGVS